MKYKTLFAGALTLLLGLASCGGNNTAKQESQMNVDESGQLLRGESTPELDAAFDQYLSAIQKDSMDIHSIMILQHGKVLKEKWMSEGAPEKAHILNSVSKTFTSTAVGFAISEGLLKLDDKLIDVLSEYAPADPQENLKKVTVKDLLTMNCGQEIDPLYTLNRQDTTLNWVQNFMVQPFLHEPGTWFAYNSTGTYLLSAMVQKKAGMKILDYLMPRLFEPLQITPDHWDEHDGINAGGWGLYLKTEDLAKMGQLLLQDGKWNGKQLLPEGWVKEASKKQVPSVPNMVRPDEMEKAGLTLENSDWVQGYGYQMWRCRHNGFRADGANGQYILVFPDLDAVIAVTANVQDMQKELNEIYDTILPSLK